MIAIILAAGAGRKLWPYAEVRNKCAIPVANVPCIRRLAEQLLSAGARGLVVVVGPHAGSVRAALAGLEDRVTWVEQPQPEGTAAAVVRTLGAIGDEPFLVAYGDVVTTPETIAGLAASLRDSDAPVTAVVERLEGGDSGEWLTADVRGGALAAIEGHGREGTYRLCGLYAFHQAAMPYLRANPGLMTHVPVGGMPPLEAEVAESVARMVDAGLPCGALEARGFALDLDKPWHLLEATHALLGDMAERLDGDRMAPGARIADSAEIHGRVVLEPGAEIGERVVVKGDLWLGPGASVTNGSILNGTCVIGARSRVRDYALLGTATTLGPDAVCGHGAEFEGVLLEGAYLYHYCEIFGVVGAKVDIGAATVCGTLRFDDGLATHQVHGRREQPRIGANASYLGDYSRTGVNAILMPGVKVGVYSCVGPGVVLQEDVPSRELVMVKQELVRKRWGPERYGW